MNLKKIELQLKAKYRPLKEGLLKHVKSDFLKDTVTQFMVIPSMFLLLSSWVLSIYFFRATAYLVPLRYNSFMGIFSLGNWYQLYLLPIVLTFCFVANIFLGNVVYEKDKFLAYILAASNIFLTIVSIAIIVNFGRLLGN